MFLDKEGRIGGKINIVDFFALCLLEFILLFLGSRLLLPRASEEWVIIEFHTAETEGWLAEKITAGGWLYNQESGEILGQVTEVKKGAPDSLVLSPFGRYVSAGREGFCSLLIRGRTMGVLRENGVEIGGKTYAIGQTVLVSTGQTQIFMRIWNIQAEMDTK